MSDGVAWAFKLIDGISAPAAHIAQNLDLVSKKLKELQGPNSQLAALASGVSGVAAAIGGIAGLAQTALSGVQALTQGFVSLGVAVAKATAFRESQEASFAGMLGGKAAGRAMFQEAAAMAKFTPFATSDVITSYKQLLASGFKPEELKTTFLALSDVASMTGGGSEAISGLAGVFGQMKASNTLNRNDLWQIINRAGPAGVSFREIYKSIADVMKVDPRMVEGMISNGQVSSEVGVFSVLDTIRRKTSGGTIGSATLAQATTLTGLMSTLDSAFEDFIFTMEGSADSSKGFLAIKGFVQDLLAVLDSSGTFGKKAQGFIRGFMDDVGEFLSTFSRKDMETFLTNALGLVQTLWSAFSGFALGVWSALEPLVKSIFGLDAFAASGTEAEKVAKAFGYAGAFVGTAISAVITPFAELARLIGFIVKGYSQLVELFSMDINWGSAPADLLKGFANGMSEGFGLGTLFGDGVAAGAKSSLQIQSPSKVFQEYGRYSAEGFQLGMDRELDTSALTPDIQMPSGGGGVGHIELHMPITVNGVQDGEDFVRQLETRLPGAMASLLERVAMSAGRA